MRNANRYGLFCERIPSNPEALLLEDIDGQQRYYSEMTTRRDRMLCLLQTLGVKKRERVMMQVDKSIETVSPLEVYSSE
ncbi:MAG: hypothetical protein KZQ92_01470 [Candidatus Thiodiazotropha sp. (ex Lucinoma borealis)]|nr:hypothetical protein [Candidatus Thiodiazotropha sp. (ex Troendleina suluensis)]MCU7862626.1 hypothetical protein [Candidatus Thiodiazotropha sp. (ex Lucinoma borealis)]